MKVEFTSASANKYLRSLQEEKTHLLREELETCTYVLAVGEIEEPPSYDYTKMRASIDEIDSKELAIRHALHRFNSETVLGNCGLTIDEALIAMAQMSRKKDRLSTLRSRQKKERRKSGLYRSEGSIEYEYANYDVAAADADFRQVSEAICKLQLELDLVNQTKVFSVNL